MNRRIISVILVAALIFTLAFPVSADEVDQPGWIDILDYSGINGTDSAYFSIIGTGSAVFDLPYQMYFGYIDVVFHANRAIKSVSVGSSTTTLTLLKIDTYTYRLYGLLSRTYTSQISFNFVGSDSSNYTRIQFLSVRMSNTRPLTYPESMTASGVVTGTGVNDTPFSLSFEAGQTYSSIFSYELTSFDSMNFLMRISVPNWRKYDYVDVGLYFVVNNLSSISCSIDDVMIPIETSIIENENLGQPSYFVNLRLDLRGVSRSGSDPVITITGISIYDATNNIGLQSCIGFIESTDPSYFVQLFVSLKAWFADLSSKIENVGLSLISSLSEAISSGVETLDSALAELETSVENQFSFWFSQLFDWFQDLGESLNMSINNSADRIIGALEPDSDAAEDVQADAADKADTIGGLNDDLNSVSKPDLSGAGTTTDIITGSQLITNTNFLAIVVNTPLIADVIMLSLILSMAGYVLFGKR